MPSLTTGSTYLFVLVATKDNAVWDISAATIQFLLRDPNGSIVTKTATITNGPAGLAQYSAVAADLPILDVGATTWARRWVITDGVVIQKSHWIVFSVPD